MDIKDRVVEFKRIQADELQEHTGNWRCHPNFQRNALRGTLKEVGIAGALTAYNSERQGGLTLIDGHLRREDYPDVEWPVLVLDVNDEEADLLLATLDPMAALAQADADQLGMLLEGIKTEDEALKRMLKGLDLESQLGIDASQNIDYDEMWQGMPEFEQGDLGPVKTLQVHFVAQSDIVAFANLIEQRITDKTKYIWYPKMERADLKAVACEDES